MIIIFIIVLTFPGLKEKISSHHFENGASEAPNVGAGIVVGSNDDLRGPVLSGLNLGSKVVVSPATVTHITDLHMHVFVQLGSSLSLLLSSRLFAGLIILQEASLDIDRVLDSVLQDVSAELVFHVL